MDVKVVRHPATILATANGAVIPVEFNSAHNEVVLLEAVHYPVCWAESQAGQSVLHYALGHDLNHPTPTSITNFLAMGGLFAMVSVFSNQGVANWSFASQSIVVPLHGLQVPSKIVWVIRNDTGLTVRPRAELYYETRRVSSAVKQSIEIGQKVGQL